MFITLLNIYCSISTRSFKETLSIIIISSSFNFSFGQSGKRLDKNTQIMLARKYLCRHTPPQIFCFPTKTRLPVFFLTLTSDWFCFWSERVTWVWKSRSHYVFRLTSQRDAFWAIVYEELFQLEAHIWIVCLPYGWGRITGAIWYILDNLQKPYCYQIEIRGKRVDKWIA